MSDKKNASIDQARQLLADIPSEALAVVERLGEVRELLDAALNEAMAEATLGGASIRSVAVRAGLSPNSVPPRLARTSQLSSYSEPDGKVSGSSIERARYDSEIGRPPPKAPLTFKPRRSTS
ncbi:hypothetical protein [Paeniglutamicibacter cryotolerans]|uniref:Uncharacterized protein n=1 Tax=Paeniglutamicibacter cryotolerans TaxID=670079 RepID=A0A839QF66_9MICC|nr:hypothetical protein [Paeniglutamicibacter cryotolerans]MBB2994789.1 hypothetical protein [Paeniglutamicibacter cryotolerans]